MTIRPCVALMTGLLATNLFAAEAQKAERLVFRTTGNDTYSDGTPVGAGECYAFVWQEDGYDFTGFPMTPPNPDDPYAMGEHIWLYDYYPVAERSESGGEIVAKCSDVLIAANSQVVWETQHGKWFVYLLDTRHKLADGTVACGYNKAETNAPVRINAYKPVTGLTDIVRELTYSPVGGKDLTGGATVADLQTDAITYQISFDARGGTVDPTSRTLCYGDAYGALPVPVREGCEFLGWFTSSMGGEPVTAGAIASSNATVYAQWGCTATFDANGGEASEETRDLLPGDEVGELPTAERKGYAFTGWFTERTDGDKIAADTKVMSNVTYYAQWSANAYDVNFNSRGGVGEMVSQKMTYDVEAVLSNNLFRCVGYTFAGWADGEDAVVTKYADGEIVSNLTDVADGTFDLYAVWQANAYTVKFNANGGEGEMAPQSFVYDQTQRLTANGFSWDGFVFDHWTNATGQVFKDCAAVLNLTDVADDEVELFANWKVGRIWDGTVANDWLELSCAQDVVELALNEEVVTDADHYFSADSGSAATLKVSGLPTGVKFDTKKRTMSGKAKKKGVFYVTVTATNKSKYTQTRVMVVKVDGAEPDDKDEIGLNSTALSNLVVGTALSSGVVTIPSGASASGLPKGLKVVKKGAVDAAGAICDSIEGIPTKGGKYTVKVTAKNPTRTTLLNVIVADPGSKYIAVLAEEGGTATKSGVYAAGATLKLTAKAKSKMAFVGWKRNDETEFIKPQGADYRATSLSMIVGAETPTRFTAYFVSAAEDVASGVAVVPAADNWTFDAAEGPSEYLFRIDSDSLPKASIKPVPAGFAFNGAKDIVIGADGEQYYRLVVKDAKKTKPGVYNLAFNVGNVSVKQTVVTNVTLVVKNKKSGLYDQDLEYELPYEVSVGVGDASKYPAFAAPAGAKVSVSGLPSGLKYKDGVITGVATKAGEFTVTITTTTNKVKVVDTVFMSVDALPAQLVGTFNGAVTNDDVMATEKLTLTATDKGKVTAKVGTLSISKTGWDRFVDGKAYMTLLKSSGKGAKAVTNTISVCVDTSCAWNTLQISGDYKIDAAGETSLSGTSAQRNPFGKSGKTYVCAEAHELALALAARTKQKINLYVTNDVESAVWVIGDAAAMKAKYPDMALPAKAPLTVQVKDTGAVTLAGKLDKAHSASGSTVLTVNEESVTADFVVGKGEKKVVASLVFEMDETGTLSVSGAAWTYVAE